MRPGCASSIAEIGERHMESVGFDAGTGHGQQHIIDSMAYTKHPDAELLRAALVGYQHQHAVLGERIAEVTRELGGRAGRPDAAEVAKPKRTMSAAARRRIGAAQRKRWAEAKKATGAPAKKAHAKGRRKMSAEGRERIAEATRKRWEAYRAEKAAREK